MVKDEGQSCPQEQNVSAQLRKLPKMDVLLAAFEQSPHATHSFSRDSIRRVLRQVLDESRKEILSARLLDPEDLAIPTLLNRTVHRLQSNRLGKLRRVINGTGVIGHTNLGRSPLASRAIEQISQIARGYNNLEYNLQARTRGQRLKGIDDLLCELTSAEAATVVNNNAAAVFLALATLTSGQNVVISRGELVEIGGSFRIPDVMKAAGVQLREVGTTNRTHIEDFTEAIDEQTALLIKIHPSNYVIKGFTHEVSLRDLVQIGKDFKVQTMIDVGSGSFFPLPSLPHQELLLSAVVQSGVDLITCSGDKLIGGPQAGIMLGKHDFIQKLKSHPMARAMRVCKLTLAAMEATLQIYVEGVESAMNHIPILNLLQQPLSALKTNGEYLLNQLKCFPELEVKLIERNSLVGGGSLPEIKLPSFCVAICAKRYSMTKLDAFLRSRVPAILTLLEQGEVLFNLRTLYPSELDLITDAIGCFLEENPGAERR